MKPTLSAVLALSILVLSACSGGDRQGTSGRKTESGMGTTDTTGSTGQTTTGTTSDTSAQGDASSTQGESTYGAAGMPQGAASPVVSPSPTGRKAE